jgi:hypothetical protein
LQLQPLQAQQQFYHIMMLKLLHNIRFNLENPYGLLHNNTHDVIELLLRLKRL